VKYQQANVFKITSLCLVLLFLGLMSASVTHAESSSFVTKWGSEGSSNGQFSSPSGIVVGPSGNIYVVDTSNNRIQEFDSSGSFITKWGSYGNSNSGSVPGPEGVAVDSSGNVYVADTNSHRILKFDSNGTFITKWGSYGSGHGQFSNPYGVAVDSSGNVYVSDTNNNRIQKFGSDGKYITQFGSEGTGYGEFESPRGVAVDSSGNIYVADSNNNRIQKFDSSGEFVTAWGSSGSGNKQFSNPYGVAVDSSGNVYVVDTNNQRIQKFNSNGKYLAQWGYWGSDDGQFYYPYGVFVDLSGNVYVADTSNNRIQKFDNNGTFITKWGSEGSDDGQFSNPYGVVVDSSGNIYVVDTSNQRVQKFDSSGTFITKWNTSGTDGDFNNPRGIAVDSSGNIYVADTSNNRIQKFDSSGTFITTWGSEGSDEGQFESPQDVAVDSSGNVYVADTNNNRIQKFDSSGEFLTSWGSWGEGHGQFCYPTGVTVDSSGNVYIADGWYSCRIQEFKSNGKYLTQWGSYGSDNGQFINPQDIAVDSSGNIYVSDTNNNRIQKFDSSGTFLIKWGYSGSDDGQFSNPQGIAVDSSGNVYVSDTSNNRIQEFSVSEKLPYYWVNGHYYNAVSVPDGITWTDAKTAAESSTYLGITGHLATITSQGENGFIYNDLGVTPGYYWLGAYQPEGSQEPDGGWQWVTGEPWNYTNWNSWAPDGYNSENVLAFWDGDKWNDYSQDNTLSGYVVEYEPTSFPVANFTSNVTSGFAPLTVQFTDLSENATEWNWNFGDGTNSTEQNPVHTFSEKGEYTVNLTVSNENGTRSKLATIKVDSLSYYSVNGHYYNAVSVPDGITWTDAKTEAESFTYLGMTGHLATITFQGENDFIYNNLGVTPSDYWLGAYQPDGSQEPDGGWQWVTGEPWDYTNWNSGEPNDNGGEDALQFYGSDIWNDYPHYYTVGGYVVEYEPTNNTSVLPVANFSSNVTSGYAPLTVKFTDLSENATSWLWDFGDGTNATEQNVSHTYTSVGKYTVNLTVSNADGSDSEVKTKYIIVNEPLPGAPVANFTANVTSGTAPLDVQFNDASTGNVSSYAWDFDNDGTVDSTEQNPVYTYAAAGNYTVNLTASNAGGIDSKVKTEYIVVSEPLPGAPVADFAATPTSGDAPLTVNFTDASAGTVSSYAWDFDNDGTVDSTKQNPVYTYNATGNYTVNLTVANAGGSDSKVKTEYIIVSEPLPGAPVADFTATPTSGDAPLTVNFTDTSTGTISSYAWDFDNDGKVDSTKQNPVYTYNAAGNYTVNLTVANAGGSDSKVKTEYIVVSEPLPGAPVANFTANRTSGTAPLDVQFTDASTGTVSSYAWDFDNDGNVDSTKQNPVYTYAAAGNYTVNLTVANAGGSDSKVKTEYIVVSEPLPEAPVANFTANVTSGTAPLDVQFNDASTGNVSSYAWDFDNDGKVDSTKQNPVYTYAAAGNYTVNLTVANAGGNDSKVKTEYIVVSEPLPGAPVANFTANVTSGTAPLDVQFTDASTGTISSYAWDFDNDGNVDSTEQNPVYTYTATGNYTVNLTVANAGGSDSKVKTEYIVVSEPLPGAPVANFTANVTTGTAPLDVQFNDASTGNVSSYAWDFDNDGTVDSTEKKPTHTYAAAGTYTVNLTVTGPDGSDSEVKTGYIDVSSTSPSKLVAAFSASPTSGKVPLKVAFTDTSTGTPTKWIWDFGDGSKSYLQNPTHKYSKAGVYTVNLTVKNTAGKNTVTKTDYIKVITKPVANFTSSVTSGKAPLKVTFTDTSTGSPTSWKWDFGDGSKSYLQNPVHKYSKVGSYTVNLTVKNAKGSNTVTKTEYIKVVTKPVADFSATPTSGKAPLTVEFTDNSTGIPTTWKWSFGDGTTSREKNPEHQYLQGGNYKVILTVSNVAGSSTVTKKNYIKVTTNTRPGVYSESK